MALYHFYDSAHDTGTAEQAVPECPGSGHFTWRSLDETATRETVEAEIRAAGYAPEFLEWIKGGSGPEPDPPRP